MHRLSLTHRLGVLAVALALVGWLSPAHAQCTTSWTNAAGGDWSNAANWSTGVPGGASNACITLAGTYTVTLDVNATINSLTLGQTSGGNTQTLLNTNRTLSLASASTVRARGFYDWQGGTTGGGSTLTNDGLIAISGGAIKDISGSTTIRNQALVTMTGTGGLRFLGGASQFVNTATGTFDLQSDADFTVFNGGNTFTNDGLFQKSGGSATSVISPSGLAFNNNATVVAETGTIRFDTNAAHDNPTFTAQVGAEIYFNAGTHTITGTISGGAAGTVRMDTGATFAFIGSGTIDYGETGFEWQSGTLSGDITNADLLRLTTGNVKDIAGASTLTNEALVEMMDGGNLRFLGGASQFVNTATGTFDLQSDADLAVFNGGNTFTNDGLFRKSGGSATSVISPSGLAFNNNATVVAETGTIRFDTNAAHDNPTFTAQAGAEIYFNAGTHTITGTIAGGAAGTIRMDTGVTLQDDGSGATIDYGGTGFEWQSGTLSGDITNAGRLVLTTGNIKDINSNTTLTNEGLVEMMDGGNLRFLGGASQFVNTAGATFDLQSDADLAVFNGGNTFTNNGLFRKSDGAGLSLISPGGLAFNNNATVVVQTGTVRFDASSTHTDATYVVQAGAEVYFNAGTQTIAGTISGNPAGTIRMDSGATLTGGTIDFGGTGFEWQSGNLAGTLTNAGRLVLTTGNIKDINSNTTLTNEGLVEMMDGGNLRFLGGASQFVNTAGATFDLQSDADLAVFNGGNTFTNNGTLHKSGGTGSSVVSTGGLTFNNSAGGIVSAESGEIDVNGPFNHAAGALIQGDGGTFDITGATFSHLGDTGPGTSPGLLTWENDWAPDAGSTLFIELGGGNPPVAGDDYDQLAVAGNAALAGTLELSIAVGDAPAIGDVYTILTAGGDLSGTFDAVVGPFGYTFDIDIDEANDEVTVEVLTVPNFDLAAINTDPTGDPIVVAKPGAIDFSYVVTNNTNAPITGDVFFTAALGSTTLAQGVILSGTLPANTSSPVLSFTQGIPGIAPVGTYTYSIKIGQFPSVVVDQVDFTVVVTSGSREADTDAEATWSLSGTTPWLGADGSVLMAVSEQPVEVAAAAGLGAEAGAEPGQSTDEGAEVEDEAEAASAAVPEAFGLASAYPNPFRSSTTFALDVPEASRVTVAVYDALGRRVAVLLDEEVEAATHRLTFDGSSLPSGVYLVRAVGAGATAMQRVTVVR